MKTITTIKGSLALIMCALLCISLVTVPQELLEVKRKSTYKDGEWLKFRVHYGLLTGGYATIAIDEKKYKGKEVHHIQGYGETTGIVGLAFGVEDYYESWVDKETDLPYKFLRKIDEGGHKKHRIVEFDQDNHTAFVKDIRKNRDTTIVTEPNVQDLVSAMYYLRNNLNTSKLKKNDEVDLTMFFDGENYPFKMKYIKKETIKTKFGSIKTLVFKPLVQSGRVFKEKESLTIWVSNDKNKIPVRIQADIAVGSLKADLEAYKGLKYPFKITFD